MSEDTEQPGPKPAAGTPGEAAVPPLGSTNPEGTADSSDAAIAAAQRRCMGVCATTRAGRQCPGEHAADPTRLLAAARELVLTTAATKPVGPTPGCCDRPHDRGHSDRGPVLVPAVG